MSRRMRRLWLAFLALFLWLTVNGQPVGAGELRLSQSWIEINAGDTYQLGVTQTGTGESLSWSSSKSSVATVERGLVTARRAGTALITVSAGTQKAACRVRVRRTNAKAGVYSYEYPYSAASVLEGASDTLYVLSRESGTITFVLEHREEEGEEVYTTSPVTVKLKGNQTEVFSWEDNAGHGGTGVISFMGTRVSVQLEEEEEEDFLEEDSFSWGDRTLVMTFTQRKLTKDERQELLY